MPLAAWIEDSYFVSPRS